MSRPRSSNDEELFQTAKLLEKNPLYGFSEYLTRSCISLYKLIFLEIDSCCYNLFTAKIQPIAISPGMIKC